MLPSEEKEPASWAFPFAPLDLGAARPFLTLLGRGASTSTPSSETFLWYTPKRLSNALQSERPTSFRCIGFSWLNTSVSLTLLSNIRLIWTHCNAVRGCTNLAFTFCRIAEATKPQLQIMFHIISQFKLFQVYSQETIHFGHNSMLKNQGTVNWTCMLFKKRGHLKWFHPMKTFSIGTKWLWGGPTWDHSKWSPNNNRKLTEQWMYSIFSALNPCWETQASWLILA